MTDVAFIFPGQGAQKVGMGREFYDSSREAKDIFDQAESIIPGLTEIILEGPEEKLTSTAYCQPAILTVSLAALKALQAHANFLKIKPSHAAGLSLGEYSALAAAEALSFVDTIRLVQKRAAFMEQATQSNPGKMAAIIGFDKEPLVEICRKTGAEVANFNSPDQIVITGHAAKVEAACALIEQEGARSVIPLDVSGAFHSTLMQPAAEQFQKELSNINIQALQYPVVSNVNARPQVNPDEVRQNLASQITSSVQWEESIRYMSKEGTQDFIEIGPGKVLSGLIRKIDPSLKVHNLQKPEDIEALSY